jgi:hypothetical protein
VTFDCTVHVYHSITARSNFADSISTVRDYHQIAWLCTND